MFSKGLYCRHVKTRACLGKVKGICERKGIEWMEKKKMLVTSVLTILLEKFNTLTWVTFFSHHLQMLQPITRRQILDFQTEIVCRQQIHIWRKWKKVIQTGRKNTVGKREIACYEQFLLFPKCFQKLVTQGRQKMLLCGNGLKWTLLEF